jgi:uncharacterized SAM-binding protein YcdF (DUF218 family)
MTSITVFLVFVAALAFLLFGKIKTAISLLFFSIGIFLLVGNGLIPTLFLEPLFVPKVNNPAHLWKSKNAIVLLGGGLVKISKTSNLVPPALAYSRIYQTARLYFDCRKTQEVCIIIVSGGDPLKMKQSEAAIYRTALLNLGIDKNNIEIESKSKNTYQNAQFTSILLKRDHFNQIVLVTSAIHLKRALLYFAHFDIHAQPIAADHLAPRFSIIPAWINFYLTDFAIHEYLGIIYFYVHLLIQPGVSLH